MKLPDTYARQCSKPVSVSLQLHSMRHLGSLDAQFEAAVEAGFASVEGLENRLMAASNFRAGLDRFQLTCSSAHVSMQTLLGNRELVSANCLVAGISSVFVNPMPIDDPFNPMAWCRAGDNLARVAEDFDRYEIRLGYHNGANGFVPLRSGRCGIEDLFRSATGSPLKWQADIGWIRRARGNPVEWLKRLKDFLVSAHIKDVCADIDVEEGWQDVGTGLLVWPVLLKAATESGARSLVVEHDNPPDPAEFARRSSSYLNKFRASLHLA